MSFGEGGDATGSIDIRVVRPIRSPSCVRVRLRSLRDTVLTPRRYLHPGDPSPRPQDRDPSSPSTGSSRWSVTSSSIPEILFCNILGCEARFRGNHRRGNLGRHMRRTHRGSPGDHLCAEPYCGKRFNRSDSRLKHYRSHHPWLTTGPPIRRGPQGTHLTDSSWELAGPRGG